MAQPASYAAGKSTSGQPGSPRAQGVRPVPVALAELRGLKSRKFDADEASAGLWRMLVRLPRLLHHVVRLAWSASRPASIAVLGLQVFSAVAAAFALLTARHVLAELFTAGPSPSRARAALPAIVVMALVFAVRGALDAGAAHAKAILLPRVRRQTRERLCRMTTETELSAFDDADWHDVLWRARERGLDCAPLAVEQLIQLVGALAGLAGVAAVLTVLHPLLVLVLVCAIAPRGWAALRSARLSHANGLACLTLERRLRMSADLLLARESATEIRACSAREALLAEYGQLATETERKEKALRRAQAHLAVLGQALGGVGAAATYLLLWFFLLDGTMPLATAGIAIIAIKTGQAALDRTLTAVNNAFLYGLYVAEYTEFVQQAANRSYPRTGQMAPENFQQIHVRNVTFAYPGSGNNEPEIQNVSLTIRRGQVVGLVGENGSGKTTLAKILAGLYRPQRGTICWDGVDIADMDLQSLHERIAIVTQNPIHWPASARTNITIGRADRPDPDQKAMLHAARQADAHGLIDELPYGYDTILSKKFADGVDLSCGQWQRISVARGYFRNAPLVFFDEPTAALDARAEAQVFRSIQQLARQHTVVLITHRLASVRHCDHIFVLRGGRLVEEGTHDELIASRQEYAEMYTMQQKAYE